MSYGLEVFDRFSRELLSRNLPQPAARLEVRAWFHPNRESRWFIVPGLVGMRRMVVVLAVPSLSRARTRHLRSTLRGALSAVRDRHRQISPARLSGLGEVSLIVVAARFGFGVPWRGDLAFLYLALMLFMLALAGNGLAI